jgi:hypothetical protein
MGVIKLEGDSPERKTRLWRHCFRHARFVADAPVLAGEMKALVLGSDIALMRL